MPLRRDAGRGGSLKERAACAAMRFRRDQFDVQFFFNSGREMTCSCGTFQRQWISRSESSVVRLARQRHRPGSDQPEARACLAPPARRALNVLIPAPAISAVPPVRPRRQSEAHRSRRHRSPHARPSRAAIPAHEVARRCICRMQASDIVRREAATASSPRIPRACKVPPSRSGGHVLAHLVERAVQHVLEDTPAGRERGRQAARAARGAALRRAMRPARSQFRHEHGRVRIVGFPPGEKGAGPEPPPTDRRERGCPANPSGYALGWRSHACASSGRNRRSPLDARS